MMRIALALLYPARLLAYLSERGPEPGSRAAALHVSSNPSASSDAGREHGDA